MSEAVEVLKRARKRIERPENWTQGVLARSNGAKCAANHPKAKKWCAIGALAAELDVPNAMEFSDEFPAEQFLFEAAADLEWSTPANLNDEADHSTVLKMFDRAICLAESATP